MKITLKKRKIRPKKYSGFSIDILPHKAKTSKGKNRFYIHLYGTKNKKWNIIYLKLSKPSAWITFEEA
jgi:hypothetical protein